MNILHINAMRLRRSKNYKEVLMKNLYKFLGIPALVSIIGFTIVSCRTNSNSGTGGQTASEWGWLPKGSMTEQEMNEWTQDASKSGASLIDKGMATVEMQTPGLTASHPSIPIGSKVRMKNIINRKEVVVTITGRIYPDKFRIVDVSPETAQTLDLGFGGPVLIAWLVP
jgi:hypothetical protein